MSSTLILYRYSEGAPINYKIVSPFIEDKIELYGKKYELNWIKMGFSSLNYKNEISDDIIVVTKDMIGFMQSRPNILMSICINNVGIIAIFRDSYQYYGKIQKVRGFQVVDNYGMASIPDMSEVKVTCIGLLKTVPITSLYPAYPNRLYLVNLLGNTYLSFPNELKFIGADFKYSEWNMELNKISTVKLASSNDDVLVLYFNDKGLLKELTKEEIENGF